MGLALGGRLSGARILAAVVLAACALACAKKEPPRPTPDPCDLTQGALDFAKDIVPPRKVKDVPPVYPEAARAKGVGGTVTLELTVSATGRPGDVKVTKGVSPEIDQAAVDAARQWEYEPSKVRGAPCPSITRVEVEFRPR